jgi:hypothetical protein
VDKPSSATLQSATVYQSRVPKPNMLIFTIAYEATTDFARLEESLNHGVHKFVGKSTLLLHRVSNMFRLSQMKCVAMVWTLSATFTAAADPDLHIDQIRSSMNRRLELVQESLHASRQLQDSGC